MAFPLNDQVYTKSFTPREYEVSFFGHDQSYLERYTYVYVHIFCKHLFVGRASLCSERKEYNCLFGEKFRTNFSFYKINSRICYEQ